MKHYYDLHVFFSSQNGFSVPVKTDKPMTKEEVINYAVKQNLIDSEDAKCVDTVEEIDENDYNSLVV